MIMYPRRGLAVQNICRIKSTKLANIWEEMEMFVKIWERSIPESVAIAIFESVTIATFKTS